MNLRSTYILFGVFVALLVALLAVTRFMKVKPSGKTDPNVLAALNKGAPPPPRSFDTIEIVRRNPKEEKIVFVRETQGWKMTEPHTLTVDARTVDRLAAQIVSARKAKADLTNSLKDYDLDPPEFSVTLKRDDESHTINFGKTSAGGDNAVVYVTSSDDPDHPEAVQRTSVDLAFKPIRDFLPLNPLSAGALNTSFAELAHGDQALAVEKSPANEWVFVKPKGYGQADYDGMSLPPNVESRPITGVKDLLETIFKLETKNLDGYVTLNASDADLKKYGLAKGEAATLTINIKRTAENLVGGNDPPVSFELLIGNKVGGAKPADKKPDDDKKPAPEPKPKEKPKDKPKEKEKDSPKDKPKEKDDSKDKPKEKDAPKDKPKEKDAPKDKPKDKPAEKVEPAAADKSAFYYARLGGERAVLKLPAAPVDALLKILATPEKLRDRELVEVTEAQVDAIDIKNGDVVIELRRLGPALPRAWKIFKGLSEPYDASLRSCEEVIQLVTQRRMIREFPPPGSDADYGFDKPASVVSLWVDGVEPPKDPVPPGDKKKLTPPKLKTDKPTVRVLFGKKKGDNLVYVKREQEGKEPLVALVSAHVLEGMLAGPLTYLDRDLPDFAANEASNLLIQRDGQTIEVKVAGPSKTWVFVQPKPLAGKDADDKSVFELLRELNRLSPETFVTEKAADLAKYGLKPPAVTVTVTTGEGDDAKKHVYLYSKEQTKDKRQFLNVKQGDRDPVFEVSPAAANLVLNADLQDPRIFRFETPKVKEITLAGFKQPGMPDTLQLVQQAPGKWEAAKPKKFVVDELQAVGFVDGLGNLQAKRFLPAAKAKEKAKTPYQLGDKERSLLITIMVEGEKEPLTLTIGALDKKERAYYAKASTRPGQVFLVDSVRFERLLARGAAYFGKP